MIASLLFVHSLYALSLNLKRGIEKTEPYAILHLQNQEDFSCQSYYGERGDPVRFICRFDKSPTAELAPIKSEFFKISFFKKNGLFEVHIVPLKKSIIKPLPPPIYENPIVFTKDRNLSRHWVVVGYIDYLPYLGSDKKIQNGLLFPIDFSHIALPSVGAVDLSGEPVFMKEKRDVETFMAIKEAFEAKKYKKALDLATDAMELYPQSIFASDFLRYRIKALVADNIKEHADEVIKLGRLFIKRYASDEYLPEVLLLLARVYSATGFVSDANYFFNRLIHEHKGTRYANLGLVYLGDQLYINGKVKEAIKSYLDAYYGAKDIDVASLAAYKLAVRYLDQGKTKKALVYLKKIWQRNRSFLLKDKEDAHKIAHQLASRHRYELAIAIDKAILKKLSKLDELYEPILFEIGEWYDEKGDVKQAVGWYQRYLDEFAYGKFSDKAKKSLDELFVAGNESNVTKAFERYDALIREYKENPIGEKALAAKINLLVRQGEYEKALLFSKEVEEIKDPTAKEMAKKGLRRAACKAFEKATKRKDCTVALEMVNRYGVAPKKEALGFIYDCLIRFADYEQALKIAKQGLKEAKAKKKPVWLCKILEALTKKGELKNASNVLEELQALTSSTDEVCPSMVWYAVQIYHGLGMYAKEMAAVEKIEKRWKSDMKVTDIYRKAYESAKSRGDQMMQLLLLKRLVALQNSLKSHPYSPWAEFALIKLYKEQKRFEKALEVAKGMAQLRLKGKAAARWRYEMGELQSRLGKKSEAKRSFEACAKMKEGGAWRTLCKEALSL